MSDSLAETVCRDIDAVTRQVGAHDLGHMGGAARRVDARRRDQPTAQLD